MTRTPKTRAENCGLPAKRRKTSFGLYQTNTYIYYICKFASRKYSGPLFGRNPFAFSERTICYGSFIFFFLSAVKLASGEFRRGEGDGGRGWRGGGSGRRRVGGENGRRPSDIIHIREPYPRNPRRPVTGRVYTRT